MQISILNGIYTDNDPNVRESYPLNMLPVAQQSGISGGYLKPADGIVKVGDGSGIARGGINWNNELYRVLGSKLVKVNANGTITEIGDVGNDSLPVTFDYSFDRLGIASNNNLFYYNGTTLSQVTDSDLGTVLDVIWIDGYFMTTDGEFLVVTDLNDPTSVSPLKYGSSEIDPDPIVALKKIRNEVYAVNRYTTEVFNNIGGSGFPFQRKAGAQIEKGCVGTHACCIYNDVLAFIGGGRNEQPSIYLGANSGTQKISTREIDDILSSYTESELSNAYLEERNDKNSLMLYVHLTNETFVYDVETSQQLQRPIWSKHITDTSYKARYFVYAYNGWQVADPTSTSYGYFDDSVSTHWGNKITWEFGTQMVYNEGNGAIFTELELVALTGRTTLGEEPRISTSYSLDGKSWSQDRYILSGRIGQTEKRLQWRRQGFMNNFRMQRFKGDSDTRASYLRLEVKLEPLER
jgi:hypothetical protein